MRDLLIQIGECFGLAPGKYFQKYRLIRYIDLAFYTSFFSLYGCIGVYIGFLYYWGESLRLFCFHNVNIITMELFLINFLLQANFVKSKDYITILQLLKTMRNLLATKSVIYRKTYMTFKTFLFYGSISLFLFALVTADEFIYLWICVYCGYLLLQVIVTIKWSILDSLKINIKNLNYLIETEIKNGQNFAIESGSKVFLRVSNELADPEANVQLWKRTHLLIIKAIASFNNVFGFSIFLFFLYIVAQFFYFIQEHIHPTNDESNISLLIVLVYQILLFSLIVIQCHDVTSESGKTSILAYELSEIYGRMNEKNAHLVEFVNFLHLEKPIISAGEFFIVDCSLLFTMMQLFMTFGTIIAQFQYN